MYQKNKNFNSGFTLIEVLVTLTLFSAASFLAMGAYSSAINLERKGSATRSVHQNLTFLTEYLGKEIRNGRIDYSAYSGGTIPVGSQDYLNLKTRGSTLEQVRISLSNNKIQVTKNGASSFITDDSVKINRLDFYVKPDTECVSTPCSQQQRVTVVLEIESNSSLGPNVPPVNLKLQTTISSRLYDL